MGTLLRRRRWLTEDYLRLSAPPRNPIPTRWCLDHPLSCSVLRVLYWYPPYWVKSNIDGNIGRAFSYLEKIGLCESVSLIKLVLVFVYINCILVSTKIGQHDFEILTSIRADGTHVLPKLEELSIMGLWRPDERFCYMMLRLVRFRSRTTGVSSIKCLSLDDVVSPDPMRDWIEEELERYVDDFEWT